MDFDYTDDQRDLRELSRNVFDRYPAEDARALQDSGDPVHSTKLWTSLAETGLLGLAFPEQYGGGGGSLFELGILFREAGHALAPTTLASTVFAGLLLLGHGSDEQQTLWLTPLCAGDLLATTAVSELGTDADLESLTTTAEETADGWSLNGTKAFVPNAEISELMVVAAKVGDVVEFFLVPARSSGVSMTRHATFGQDTQNLVTLDGVVLPLDARLQPDTGDRSAALAYAETRTVMTALQNMELLGGVEQVLAKTSGYVTVRHQFGRPIGSFQAVQHIVADMASEVAAGDVTAHHALWLVSAGRPAVTEVALANAWLAPAFVRTTVWSHQLHGGMGFVRESTLYLWSQRAKALELQLGGRRRQLETVADRIFAEPTRRR
jgi:alkylation response protein AidB-like acyl-CoA dehydrogenase